LGARAFSSKESTAVLNSITHPFISALFIQELERLANEGCKKVVFDAPQLFESRLNVLCDVIVGVTADEPIRIKRITERDNISEGNAKKRIAVQYSKEFFENNCDYIIENNFSLEKLEKQTADIIYKLDK
jgi:dephospho-CoA kinase